MTEKNAKQVTVRYVQGGPTHLGEYRQRLADEAKQRWETEERRRAEDAHRWRLHEAALLLTDAGFAEGLDETWHPREEA